VEYGAETGGEDLSHQHTGTIRKLWNMEQKQEERTSLINTLGRSENCGIWSRNGRRGPLSSTHWDDQKTVKYGAETGGRTSLISTLGRSENWVIGTRNRREDLSLQHTGTIRKLGNRDEKQEGGPLSSTHWDDQKTG
jgi:hypothetical protein